MTKKYSFINRNYAYEYVAIHKKLNIIKQRNA
jgi:hypothetical protein